MGAKTVKLLHLLLAVDLVLASACAVAQTQITLGGSTQAVTFQGSTSSITEAVTLGHCNHAGVCKVSGGAYGTGSVGQIPYTISSMLNTITITLVNAATGIWSFAQSKPVTFAYGRAGSLLEGFLTFESLDQKPGTSTATADALLTVTGGSLAGVFGPEDALDVTIKFHSKKNLESLLGTKRRLQGKLSSGDILLTPEPSSMLLIGSAFLVAGTMLRFRRRSRWSSTNEA
jgi:hypothetical protein